MDRKRHDGPRSNRGPSVFRWMAALGLGVVGLSILARFGGPVSDVPSQPALSPDRSETFREQLATRAEPTPIDDETRLWSQGPQPLGISRNNVRDASHTLSVRLTQALEFIQAETDPIKREELLRDAINDIAPQEIPLALAVLQSADPTEFTSDLSVRLLRRWAENDARSAADWAEQLPSVSLREQALSGVAIKWANREPSEAVTWARQLAQEAERHQALRDVAYEFIRTEPIEALRLVTELPPEAQHAELVRQAAMEWASQDGPSAAQWARQIADSPLREQVLAAVATAWSEGDPVSAATLAVSELPAGRTHDDAVVGIAQRWAQQAPEQVAAWVEQFPAGELKLAAVENVAAQWSSQNASQAEQWRSRMNSVEARTESLFEGGAN